MADTDEKKKDGTDTADQTGAGGNANTTGDAAGKNDTGSEGGTSSTDKTFTQKEVNSMMTKEKKQGREAAYREMGIDPSDTKMVSMFKAFIESQKSDEQKASEAAAQNAAKIADAERRANLAEAKAEAMMLGIKSQYVDDAVTIAMSKMIDSSDLKSIIGELKTKYPIWFGSDDAAGEDNVGSKGTGTSMKVGNKNHDNGKEGKGIGNRLATQRQSYNTTKKSFWD